MKELKLEVGVMGTVIQTVLVEDHVTLEDFFRDKILTSVETGAVLVTVPDLKKIGVVVKQEVLDDCEYNITVIA